MAILRTEISNPNYGRKNTTLLTIHSSHIKGRQDISVYHHDKLDETTPIVILLHGVYGSNWVWMDLGGAHIVYEQLKQQGLSDFILVMPSDGGLWDGSAYLPLNEYGNYEQWIMEDVMNAVTENINGANNHSEVYLCGLSMGGYGTLKLGAKYPHRFSGLSAHSSVTSLEDLQQFIENPISDYQCSFEKESELAYWFDKNKSSIPPLRLDCGTQDSLYETNLALCSTFNSLNIRYQFESLSGGHEWQYWHENLAKTLMFFDDIHRGKIEKGTN